MNYTLEYARYCRSLGADTLADKLEKEGRAEEEARLRFEKLLAKFNLISK